ncbi:hypothetical protein BFJ63_vAg20201 [Fusarium oxysporum f. sp. narcissi]|uniref:Uncharacterized protein n=1 Tax=Fusarium oxysporum f. sp. narcissi TaxID=451672 RepID=A0A4Q2UST3_FUSOX|nr:hypothetical protein BFJ63_vAg20201 [Fusarium oxysporum f. sp. narcissi]
MPDHAIGARPVSVTLAVFITSSQLNSFRSDIWEVDGTKNLEQLLYTYPDSATLVPVDIFN